MTIGRMMTLTIDAAVSRLARDAAAALATAALDEALELIMRRIVAAEAAYRVEAAPGCAARIRLAPFAELVLLEVAAVARDVALDSATKTQRIGQIVEMAGY